MSRKKSDRRSSYRNAYYNYSSEAYKYSSAGEYTSRVGRTGRKRRTVSERGISKARRMPMKAIKKVQYEFVKSESIFNNFGVIFLVGTFFAFLIIMLCSFAANSQISINITTLNNELKQIKESNTVMETELIKNLDMEKIEKIAITQLGMQKPAKHQVIYIDVPKQSYTVQYSNNNDSQSKDNSEKSLLLDIWEFLFGG